MKSLIIITSVILAIYLGYRTYKILTLTKGLDKILAKRNVIILDVRTKNEFNSGHIEGSVNIPLSRLHKGTIPYDTGTIFVTCCSHGLRSVRAVNVLNERGFKHVYNGGAWNDLEKVISGIKIK